MQPNYFPPQEKDSICSFLFYCLSSFKPQVSQYYGSYYLSNTFEIEVGILMNLRKSCHIVYEMKLFPLPRTILVLGFCSQWCYGRNNNYVQSVSKLFIGSFQLYTTSCHNYIIWNIIYSNSFSSTSPFPLLLIHPLVFPILY